eukprot:4633350-Prymnesium_polylepis.1
MSGSFAKPLGAPAVTQTPKHLAYRSSRARSPPPIAPWRAHPHLPGLRPPSPLTSPPFAPPFARSRPS